MYSVIGRPSFPFWRPKKTGSGQRTYRRRDVEMALRIKQLLYDENTRSLEPKRSWRPSVRGGPVRENTDIERARPAGSQFETAPIVWRLGMALLPLLRQQTRALRKLTTADSTTRPSQRVARNSSVAGESDAELKPSGQRNRGAGVPPVKSRPRCACHNRKPHVDNVRFSHTKNAFDGTWRSW